MPTPIDPKRLPRLKAARKRYKPGEKIAQQELAKLYGVTNARFTTLAHERFEGMPTPERRGDKTHWYDAVKSIDAMIRYCTGATATKRAAAKRAAAVLGDSSAEAESGQPERQQMTPAEIDKLASAQTRVFRLAQEKGMFVRATAHQYVVRRIFALVQRAISAFPSEADPNGELPPMIRARLDTASRDAMKRLHDEVGEFLNAPEEEAANAA